MSSQCLVSGRDPAMAITTVVLAIEVKIKVKRFCFIFFTKKYRYKDNWDGTFKSQRNLCYFFTAYYLPEIIWKSKDIPYLEKQRYLFLSLLK